MLSSWELSRKYRFTDYDDRRPDWGKHTIDWSVVPPPLVEVFRNGIALELKMLPSPAKRAWAMNPRPDGPAKELRVCYEAGPTGYVVYWQLTALGVRCRSFTGFGRRTEGPLIVVISRRSNRFGP